MEPSIALPQPGALRATPAQTCRWRGVWPSQAAEAAEDEGEAAVAGKSPA